VAYAVEREELARLEPEWRDLLPKCSLNKVFVSPTWLREWWGVFGEGRELILLSVRKEGELVGIVPLMREGESLSLAGDTEVCDYMDIVAARGEEEAVLTAVLRSLGEEPWRDLTLWALREDSPTLPALKAVAPSFGLSVDVVDEDVCPQLELPASWEEFLATLNKKDRHELRRKLRKLSQGGEVELESIDEPAAVESALNDFLALYAESRTEKADFMTERMERFFRAIIGALAAEGKVEVMFLKLGGLRVAGVLCFCGGDESLLYNSGYRAGYSYLSVGLLSKALMLRKAIQEGKKRFDFLRGPEPYKYDLGARDLAVYRCTVRRE
jgi:CelD/BcsL family acetyltransferase involved in cellulose biosynthesis